MKNRILNILLAVLLIAGVLSGCSSEDEAAEVGTSPTGVVTDGNMTEAGNDSTLIFASTVLTDNRALSGGIESDYIKNLEYLSLNIIPTARATSSGAWLKASESIMPTNPGPDSIVTTYFFSYNENGQQVASQMGDRVYETFDYDEAGRLIRHIRIDKEVYCYNYDADGLLLSIDHYKYDYYPNYRHGYFLYQYTNGELIRIGYYGDAEDTLQYYTEYSDGKETEYKHGTGYLVWEVYKYDDNGNLIAVLSGNDHTELLREYHYDEYGVLFQADEYYDGKLDRSVAYLYNEAGDCIKAEVYERDSDGDELDCWFEFTYDEYGNLLTERYYDDDGEPESYYMEYAYDSMS